MYAYIGITGPLGRVGVDRWRWLVVLKVKINGAWHLIHSDIIQSLLSEKTIRIHIYDAWHLIHSRFLQLGWVERICENKLGEKGEK